MISVWSDIVTIIGFIITIVTLISGNIKSKKSIDTLAETIILQSKFSNGSVNNTGIIDKVEINNYPNPPPSTRNKKK
ncbi:MAG: hypothetical protein COU65_04725 [Candidatus Pacebacteria bacterium CG10_big_fil_rev_8_21_14_0_10_42_12]|nr:MAG: hypothetical protein COU65_04725 [Candidatus Pacebacteria bacterium CG10_big_fil_rev_8_21_14_0_10_42_12]